MKNNNEIKLLNAPEGIDHAGTTTDLRGMGETNIQFKNNLADINKESQDIIKKLRGMGPGEERTKLKAKLNSMYGETMRAIHGPNYKLQVIDFESDKIQDMIKNKFVDTDAVYMDTFINYADKESSKEEKMDIDDKLDALCSDIIKTESERIRKNSLDKLSSTSNEEKHLVKYTGKEAEIICRVLKDRNKPENEEKTRYASRELSWLKFNSRVLDIAKDPKTPLYERLRFVSITSSNLDEFMMVRLGALKNMITSENNTILCDGNHVELEYSLVSKGITSFIDDMRATYLNILKELEETKSVRVVKYGKNGLENTNGHTGRIRKFISNYFENKIYYSLTPIVFDESRPFPLVKNNTLNIAVLLEDETLGKLVGTMYVPSELPRFVEIKDKKIPENEHFFISIEDIIRINLNKIFINKKIVSSCSYRVIRNTDIDVMDNKNKFLADKMFETIKEREIGKPLRMEISTCKKELYKILQKAMELSKSDIIKTHTAPVKLSTAHEINLKHIDGYEEMVYPKFTPQIGEDLFSEPDIFEAMDEKDLVLHHPYDTFDHVVNMIQQASVNPDVLTIKQTLYRVSENSPIMEALIKAAKNGKQVTCLLEVKARFNEEDNLHWAERLEAAGGYVIYGVDNLKTHCKMTLIAKRTKKKIKTYCHLGTGNYNDVTSKIYTDISYFTTNTDICNDVAKLFNTITGFSEPRLKKIVSAPHNLRNEFNRLIDQEIQCAKEGKPAKIVAKCNSVNDIQIINKLYEASQAGVKVELIVRGVCCLKTGREYSKNITVKSIVGRYLEHSRIYQFENNKHSVYISSADLMTRNLDKRFEILIPIVNKISRTKIENILDTFRSDTTAYLLEGEDYVRDNNLNRVSSQEIFMSNANSVNKFKNVNKIYIRERK